MTVEQYPKSFPEPLMEGYSIGVDMGVTRTVMEKGRARQRRRHRTMPQTFTFNFAVPIAQLGSWQAWINAFAYDWFKMNATSYITGSQGASCSPHIVRFISDLNIAPLTDKVMTVSVAAEMASAEAFHTPPAVLTNDWIVGNRPQDNLADWIIANKPNTAPTDWVVAGSPTGPAAYV